MNASHTTSPQSTYSPAAKAGAEFIATAALLTAVVGSGIAAENLSGGNAGLALLANALATSAALFVLILTLAPVSGAHMNPAVSIAAAVWGRLPWALVPVYAAAQVLGAVSGTWLAHGMFELPLLQWGTHARTGTGQWLAEFIATAGLLGVIRGCARYDVPLTAAAVAAYIGGAYWFTASTSFANPAVTLARALTDTFAGIRPADTLGFIAAQAVGLAVVLVLLQGQKRR
ncbi:MAG: aquaporin family protein [Rhodospirillaceae bacterium]|nr:aquaporin family protein [Rhodospirillaceae bacterium]